MELPPRHRLGPGTDADRAAARRCLPFGREPADPDRVLPRDERLADARGGHRRSRPQVAVLGRVPRRHPGPGAAGPVRRQPVAAQSRHTQRGCPLYRP